MTEFDKAPALLTIDEVTDRLRVSRSTFYRAVKSGELPAFKVGGGWRVDPRDLEALIQSRKTRQGHEVWIAMSDPDATITQLPGEATQ